MEFTLPDAGGSSLARAILIQAAEGTLPLSSAKEIMAALMPGVSHDAVRKEDTRPLMEYSNAYLLSLMQQSTS